jgi:methylmalonyl-CoA mutase
LEQLRANRNNEEVQAALDALTRAAETNEGNLLALSIDAARKRASLGEISTALEKVYGRYKAVIRSISGVYSSESKTMTCSARPAPWPMILLPWKAAVPAS